MLQLFCPCCGRESNVSEELAGLSGRCGQCGEQVRYPDAPPNNAFGLPASGAFQRQQEFEKKRREKERKRRAGVRWMAAGVIAIGLGAAGGAAIDDVWFAAAGVLLWERVVGALGGAVVGGAMGFIYTASVLYGQRRNRASFEGDWQPTLGSRIRNPWPIFCTVILLLAAALAAYLAAGRGKQTFQSWCLVIVGEAAALGLIALARGWSRNTANT
jgi:hypothetical protein